MDCNRASADGTAPTALLPEDLLQMAVQSESGCRPVPASAALSQNTAERSGYFQDGCSARYRAPSSWKAETRGCSRPDRYGRYKGSTTLAAGSSGPTAHLYRGRKRCALWLANALHRVSLHRTLRQNHRPAGRPAAPASSGIRSTSASPVKSGSRHSQSLLHSARQSASGQAHGCSCREIRSSRGTCSPYQYASAETEWVRDKTLSVPGAASPMSPCRWSKA